MRIRSLRLLSLTLACAALPLSMAGCSKRSSSNNNQSVVAPTTSSTGGATTSTTTGATTSTTTAPTTSTVAAGTLGGTPVVVGGNTSSGSATSGATAAGFGKGTGRFVDGTANLPTSASNDYGADSGDLDGDGDIDIAIAVMDGPSRILWNDGKGKFSLRTTSFPALTMKATDVRLIDADKDGDFDLIFSCNFEPARLFLNDGAGNFTLAASLDPQNDAYVYKLAIGDADGDGWSDVFFARAGQSTTSKGQNKLFLSDKVRGFVEAPAGTIPVKFDDSLDATFLDVNGDGHKDIFVANFGTRPTLLVNDGTGKFLNQTDVYVPATLSTYATSVAQGDLDKDGDVDLFLGNEGAPGSTTPPPGEVNSWLNNQGPNKTLLNAVSSAPTDAEATWKLRLIDVNADGWLDVVASQLRSVQRLYLNQNGVLVDATAFLPAVNQTPSNSYGVVIGDFNGDQAPDLFFVRRNAQPWLFLNTP
ncbi:MAG: FG-GAP repeat domain-containing protein [Planctomycetota bacterium]